MEFLCPHGHKIHCSDEQAGRAAKCPRCGVKFVIPVPAEQEPETGGEDTTITAAHSMANSTSGSSPPVRSGPSPSFGEHPPVKNTNAQIEFLCPNGHHLHGPASLQGRPGECPECGSRFRIPTYDESAPESAAEDEISLAGLDGGSSVDLPETPVMEDAEPSLPPQYSLESTAAENRGGARLVSDPIPLIEPEPIPLEPDPISVELTPAFDSAAKSLSKLVSKLWDGRSDSAQVEVHLAGGDVLLPQVFAKTLSERNHAVFALKDPDESYTIHAVPWESITRIVVRGMKELPADFTA